MKVKIENTYSNGHESERIVEFTDEPPADNEAELDRWWDEVVFDETGDGTGIPRGIESHYEATIIEATNEALVGLSREWC